MRFAPFDKEREYDIMFEQVIGGVKKGVRNDDDFLLICAGDPGTGKTRLMFHGYTLYAGDSAVIDQVALNQRDFANVIDRASRISEKSFAGYDEANVSKREALTKWNRELIDLYMNIRGLNIFHWWNNPSIDMLDKPFIEERVKGVIFVLTKDKTRPRMYYYFTKDGLLRMLEEKGNLKKRTIQKFGGSYAFYMGWFRDYDGPLLAAYLSMKKDRMVEKVALFKQKFAPTDKTTLTAYSKNVLIDHGTARKIFNYGIQSGYLKEGEHYVLSGTGSVFLLPAGVLQCDFIRENDLHRKNKRPDPLKKKSNRLSPFLAVNHSIYPKKGVES